VTLDAVWTAMEKLAQQGRPLTTRNVHTIVGGSRRDICRLVRQVKAELEAVTDTGESVENLLTTRFYLSPELANLSPEELRAEIARRLGGAIK
jgi:hypothetical protein